jgi:hypothetical protein
MMETHDDSASTLIKSAEEASVIREQLEQLSGCLEGTEEERLLMELHFKLWVWDDLELRRAAPPYPWCTDFVKQEASPAMADRSFHDNFFLVALASASIYLWWDSLTG